jgi:hypothetical protein
MNVKVPELPLLRAEFRLGARCEDLSRQGEYLSARMDEEAVQPLVASGVD